MHSVRMQSQMELRPPEHLHSAERRPPLLCSCQKPRVRLVAIPVLVFIFPDGVVVKSGVGGPEPCSSPY